MDQHNRTHTEKNDWVARAIPSARHGVRGLNKLTQGIPGVNLLNPGTYKTLYQRFKRREGWAPRGQASLHYGALRFEDQGYGQLTEHNQPKIFRSILRNEALYNDPAVQHTVQTMSTRPDAYGYKFEIKCTENANHGTSIFCPENRPDTIIISIGRNSPQATKAALLMAHEVSLTNLRPSEINFDSWVQHAERSPALKDAMRSAAVGSAGNGLWNISHRVQAVEPAQHRDVDAAVQNLSPRAKELATEVLQGLNNQPEMFDTGSAAKNSPQNLHETNSSFQR